MRVSRVETWATAGMLAVLSLIALRYGTDDQAVMFAVGSLVITALRDLKS